MVSVVCVGTDKLLELPRVTSTVRCLSSDPVPPPAPMIETLTSNAQTSDIIYISLARTSTKYGPISGYELQFIVVLAHEVVSGKISRPLVHQLGAPQGGRGTVKDAINSGEPVDFAYKRYTFSSLPRKVAVNASLLNGALKTDTTYSAVLVAYTNDTVSGERVCFECGGLKSVTLHFGLRFKFTFSVIST